MSNVTIVKGAENNNTSVAVKHNDIIQNSKYKLNRGSGGSLSVTEQKILLYVISKIKYDDTRFEYIDFTIKEFCEVCGINPRNGDRYTRLKECLTKLRSRTMWLYNPDDDFETTVGWVSKIAMSRGNGKVRILLDDDLKPYLLGLKGNFTQIPIADVMRISSKHAVTLYELLRSYYYLGNKIKFNIDDLKERLDCLSYESFYNFKTKVIIPSIEDINLHTDLCVDVEYIKTGRSYTDVVFTIFSD